MVETKALAMEEDDDNLDPNFYYEWTEEMTAEAEKILKGEESSSFSPMI